MHSTTKTLLAVIIAVLFTTFVAWAQQEVLVVGRDSSGTVRRLLSDDAGRLVVSFTGSSSSSSSSVTTFPSQCTTSPETVVNVSNASTSVPAAQTAGRQYVVICNSKRNSAGLIQCTVDSTVTLVYGTSAGKILDIGDCIAFAVASTVVPKCIASVVGPVVAEVSECVP